LRGSAVFLDVDGTLLDLAATPDAVIVPPHLRDLLLRLAERAKGALALITGRSLADVDRLIGPGLAVAAEHGAVLRDAEGHVFESIPHAASLGAIRDPLRAAVAQHPGSLLEEKRFGLVLHWRGAPKAAGSLTERAITLTAPYAELMLQPAHAALEIRQRGPGKAAALDRFMRSAPFTGRRPLFIGDDLTDEPAIARATARGGRGLHVGRDFAGRPAAVLAWLEAALAGEGESENG
jgi:trehalose 6-phosphate phosphatase